MWIASKLGFYSLVQKSPQEWHLRARVRGDLVNLIGQVYTEPAVVEEAIEEWPEADDRWRLIVTDEQEMLVLCVAPTVVPRTEPRLIRWAPKQLSLGSDVELKAQLSANVPRSLLRPPTRIVYAAPPTTAKVIRERPPH